jgi:hypothetical protein
VASRNAIYAVRQSGSDEVEACNLTTGKRTAILPKRNAADPTKLCQILFEDDFCIYSKYNSDTNTFTVLKKGLISDENDTFVDIITDIQDIHTFDLHVFHCDKAILNSKDSDKVVIVLFISRQLDVRKVPKNSHWLDGTMQYWTINKSNTVTIRDSMKEKEEI